MFGNEEVFLQVDVDLGPRNTGSDKVRNTAPPTFYSIVINTTPCSRAKLCRRHLTITIKVCFVGAVQEKPLAIPEAAMFGACHASPSCHAPPVCWGKQTNQIQRTCVGCHSRCAEGLMRPYGPTCPYL